ncbi:hypothetical protein GCM10027343_36640 [Noviherbaspirillum agri]
MHAEPEFVHRKMAEVERLINEIDAAWFVYLNSVPTKDERERGPALVRCLWKIQQSGAAARYLLPAGAGDGPGAGR